MGYGKIDGIFGFRALNMSIYILKGYSNEAGKVAQMEKFEIAKFETFLLIPREPMEIWQNGWYG